MTEFRHPETNAQLAAEKEVADSLLVEYGFKCNKMKEAYRLDFCVQKNGRMISYIEIKGRNCPSGQYPTLMLSLDKWYEGLRLSRGSHVPAWLGANYTDGIKWVQIKEVDGLSFNWGGREDRLDRYGNKDMRDQEPCVFIPKEFFMGTHDFMRTQGFERIA